MSHWQDKVVVVTGGSAGLGLHVARAAHGRGAQVVLVARHQDRLHEAARAIGDDRVLCVAADITDQADVDRAFEDVIARHGRVDALVNCAGKSARGEIASVTVDEFRELIELNFLALVRCSHAALPHLRESKGHLVNIGSLAAKSASKYLGAYPASKFPVAAYSQQLRLELSEHGVHVLLVCPGPIRRDDAGLRYTDESVPASAQLPGGGVKLKGIDPAWLAQRILRACERRELELVVPWKARMLFAISQLSPRWGDWLVRVMTSS